MGLARALFCGAALAAARRAGAPDATFLLVNEAEQRGLALRPEQLPTEANTFETLGGAVAALDYGNDGWLDSSSSTGRPREHLRSDPASFNRLLRTRAEASSWT